jgi:putative nucleotidyltransferase with HDIG domain
MPQVSTSFQDAGRGFKIYYLSVVLLNASLLWIISSHIGRIPWTATALWTACYMIALVARVPTARDAHFNISAALDYAGLIVLGAPLVAVINLVTTLAWETALRRPMLKVVFNASLYSLMVLASGSVYYLFGGPVGAHFTLGQCILPLLLAGFTGRLVNLLGVSLVRSFFERIPASRAWQQMDDRRDWREWGFWLVSLSTGVLIASMYAVAHTLGFILSIMPLALNWRDRSLYSEIRSDLRSFVRALTSIIEEVDPYTRNHSLRVAEYAAQLARGMGLSEQEVETIEIGGLLHDLGKVGDDFHGILQKAARLTPEERRRIERHPLVGADIVETVRALRPAACLVRAHHERPDGSGYPRRLKGNEIPLGASIIRVADTFDAITSDRAYRSAGTAERAIRELRQFAGTQFDAAVVDTLVRMYTAGEFHVLYERATEPRTVPLHRVSGETA